MCNCSRHGIVYYYYYSGHDYYLDDRRNHQYDQDFNNDVDTGRTDWMVSHLIIHSCV